MPCRSEGPPAWQEYTTRVAKLVGFVKSKLKIALTGRENQLIKGNYPIAADEDFIVATLCDLINKMSSVELDNIVYNGRDKDSRELADWWDRHQETDRERLREEREAKKQKRLKQQALAKLTLEERKALGL